MINLLNVTFGFADGPNGTPAFYVFGYPIYLYAIIIVTGMCLAMLIGAYFFKKRGYDPYDMAIYSIFIIPLAILGCRLYVYIFPWAGSAADWSTFFNFRSGGLGIYGGVVLGYITGFVVCKVRKQNFGIVADCIMPGLFLAQSIGRWGNFVNQEAYGPIISNIDWQWFPFGVYIDSTNSWHYATFFYESVGTFIGFIVCLLLLRNKNYRLGWLTAFYGIYYGIVRLLVESLRTDSLFLWIGTTQTDIKISQLVSVFTIILGILTLAKIYRSQIHKWYSKFFASERDEVAKSRWLCLALSIASLTVAIVMFVLGGESKFIAGFFLAVLAVYSAVGIFALHDRLKLYCPKCGNRCEPEGGTASKLELGYIRAMYMIVVGIMLVMSSIVLLSLGTMESGSANMIVVAVILLLLCIPITIYIVSVLRQVNATSDTVTAKSNSGVSICQCGEQYTPALNKHLLALFPYKEYKDYTIDKLVEWVDPEKLAKQQAKQDKEQNA